MKRYRIEASVLEDEMNEDDIEDFLRDTFTAQGLVVDGVCVYEVML